MNTETNDDYTSTANGSTSGNATTTTGSNGSSTDGTVRRVAEKAHKAVDTIEHAIGTGSEQIVGWHHEYGELAREQVRANPLAFVAGALAVGYLFAKITR